ncbi:MAG: hypothetical protein Q9191_001059 [Dirinaria sp. TL-2023a]
MHFTTPIAILASLSLALASPLESLEKRTTGQITYYDAGAGIGACGQNNGGKLVAALSPSVYSASKCGKSIKVTNSANGKSVTVKVGDKCAGCDANHIDLSETAFKKIGNTATGVLQGTWNFV